MARRSNYNGLIKNTRTDLLNVHEKLGAGECTSYTLTPLEAEEMAVKDFGSKLKSTTNDILFIPRLNGKVLGNPPIVPDIDSSRDKRHVRL